MQPIQRQYTAKSHHSMPYIQQALVGVTKVQEFELCVVDILSDS